MLNKLKSNDFRSLRENGKKFKTKNFLFVYSIRKVNIREQQEENDGTKAPNQFNYGFTVTKKIGKAYLRNRLKRLLREVVREAVRMNTAQIDSQLSKDYEIHLDLNIVVLHNKPEEIEYPHVQEQVQTFFNNKLFG